MCQEVLIPTDRGGRRLGAHQHCQQAALPGILKAGIRGTGRGSGQSGDWQCTSTPTPAAGKYKESHLVLADCPQHLERSAEGLSFDISMVQKYMRATGHSSIQGVTGHRGGVGMSRDLRHRILASTHKFRKQPQAYVFMYIRSFYSLCLLGEAVSTKTKTKTKQTSVHLLLMCPFGGVQNRRRVAALTMHVHATVSTPSLVWNACYGLASHIHFPGEIYYPGGKNTSSPSNFNILITKEKEALLHLWSIILTLKHLK